MNLVADENVDSAIVDRLRQDGHDVVSISELSPSIGDDRVLDEANVRGAMLLTADKDFGELVYRLGRVHSGVVLLRLADVAPETVPLLVSEVIRDRGAEFPGAFTVIAPGLVRVRRSTPLG